MVFIALVLILGSTKSVTWMTCWDHVNARKMPCLILVFIVRCVLICTWWFILSYLNLFESLCFSRGSLGEYQWDWAFIQFVLFINIQKVVYAKIRVYTHIYWFLIYLIQAHVYDSFYLYLTIQIASWKSSIFQLRTEEEVSILAF